MSPTAGKAQKYDSALEGALLGGDIAGVMDLIAAMAPAERDTARACVAALTKSRWDLLSPGRKHPLDNSKKLDEASVGRAFRAIDLARFMCSEQFVESDYWMHIDMEDIPAFKARFNPPRSHIPIERQLYADKPWSYRHRIHRAIVAGLVERPEGDEYLDALYHTNLSGYSNAVLVHFAMDPGIAPYLLQLFDLEGTSERSFASVDNGGDHSWGHAFLDLCKRGVYTRAQLLDKTLGALARDWPQFRSGWFSRFHARLEPSVAEMAPEAARYLALCHSRIPPTAAMALRAVQALYTAGLVSGEAVCEACAPLATSAVKAQATAVLQLLSAVVERTPQLSARASSVAVQTLAHTAPDLQKKALHALAKWGLNEDARALARSYLPLVAAVNRPGLAQLVGHGQEELAPPHVVQPSVETSPAEPQVASGTGRRVSPLNASQALTPLETIPDIVERLAFALENPADVDEWERVAAALVRIAPIVEADKPAFLAVQRRGTKMDKEGQYFAYGLTRILAAATNDEPLEECLLSSSTERLSVEHFLEQRIQDFVTQALVGQGLTPLSTPTHRGGFIDPRVLVTRIREHRSAGVTSPMAEQVQAVMRLVPAAWDETAAREALHQARSLEVPTALERALRYALGDDLSPDRNDVSARPLFLAAARVRAPYADDQATLEAYGDLGPDGPLHARPDWYVSTESGEDRHTRHVLHITCEPSPDAQLFGQPYCLAMALCAKHLTGSLKPTEKTSSNIRYAASILPSGLEPFFAEAARTMGNNLDWFEAQWQNRSYLDVMLCSTTEMGPMARLTLAAALGGKEPGQSALAVDALVQCVQDGRLNVHAMGATFARLWSTPLVKGARYAKSLASAAQASASMPLLVPSWLCTMLEAPETAKRRDTAALLELLLELSVAHKWALPASTSTALSTLAINGKGKATLRELLAQNTLPRL